MTAINPKILITLLIETLVFSLVPFIAAGTLFWLYDWIFLILLYTWSFVTVLWVPRHNPGLIEERVVTGFNPDEPTWDKMYMIVLFIQVSIWWISCRLRLFDFICHKCRQGFTLWEQLFYRARFSSCT